MIFFFALPEYVPPAIGVSIVAALLTALVTFAYKWLTNQEQMKSMKDDLKLLQQEMKLHKANPPKVMELQKQAMEKNLVLMKHSMKPTLYTFIPLIIIFGWIRTTFGAPAGEVNPVLWHMPIVGWGMTWLWTYLIVSILVSMLIRKLFKIY
ncbi:MAG: EMC3/TMCO1 family protein [Nanoarchaeota archaeon]|nr:EMC3/TMCO1 family protein [Nanoarchaeota archaeon]